MNNRKFLLIYKLLKIVRPLYPIMIITVFMGVVGFLSSIGITFLGSVALLVAIGEIDIISIHQIFYIVIGLAILRGILRYAEQYSGHYIAFRVLAIIRDRVFTALRKLAPAKLDEHDKGSLIAIITTDIELLEVFFAHTIAPVLIAIITGIIILYTVAQYSIISMIIILLGYISVSLIIPKIITNLGEQKGATFRDDFANLSSYILESLKGIRESMQYDDTHNRTKQMKKLTRKMEKTNEDLKKYEELSKALSDLSVIVTSSIVFFYTYHTMITNTLPLSSVVIPTTLALSSFGPFIALSNLSNNLLQTFSSGQRVIDLLEETPQVDENTSKNMATYDDIKVNDVSFRYKDKNIFDNTNATFEKNKIIGLLGKSGSGKSTLLKLIMRFWDVNSGDISISNNNIKDINTSSLRDIQSYVTQETILFTGTIKDNIKIANKNASDYDVISAAKKASIHEFIDKLPKKYDTMVGDVINSLSSGEKQRISMARAFLHNSNILLLDEPTSNLDSLNEAIILKSIKEESKNKTVILVSHRKSTLAISDKIYALGDKV